MIFHTRTRGNSARERNISKNLDKRTFLASGFPNTPSEDSVTHLIIFLPEIQFNYVTGYVFLQERKWI